MDNSASPSSTVVDTMGSVVGASIERVRARSAMVTDTVSSVVRDLDSATLSSAVADTVEASIGTHQCSASKVNMLSDRQFGIYFHILILAVCSFLSFSRKIIQ